MKLLFKKDHILVISPSFVKNWGRISTGTTDAKGAAFFPFIFVRSEEFVLPWLINHERIHFRQQLETLIVGLPIISFIERLYARLFLKKNKMERYLYGAAEQEAYLNMHDPEYLSKRPFGRVFHYIRSKREFKLVGPGQLEFTNVQR